MIKSNVTTVKLMKLIKDRKHIDELFDWWGHWISNPSYTTWIVGDNGYGYDGEPLGDAIDYLNEQLLEHFCEDEEVLLLISW